jgi:predicted outer membrane repeat protein
MKGCKLLIATVLVLGLAFARVSAAANQCANPSGTCTTSSCATCSSTVANAIASASPGDTVILEAGVFKENNLSVNTNNLTITGAGQSSGGVACNPVTPTCASGATCIDGTLSGPVMSVGTVNPTVLTISNLTIQCGDNSSTDGGGIINSSNGTLTLNNVTVRANGSAGNGGGIENDGTLTVNSSTIGGANVVDGNHAPSSGGGVNNAFSSTFNLNNSTVSNNKADLDGGGLFCDASTQITIVNGHVDNNTADSNGDNSGDGGGIYAYGNDGGATITISQGTTINGNQAQNGGGIFNGPEAITSIDNSIISNNKAMVNNLVTAVGGGGIFNFGTMIIVNGSTIDHNHADQANGGGIYHTIQDFGTSLLGIDQTTISNNTAGGDGGGIYRDSTIDIQNSTISGNQANLVAISNGEGGGIYNNGNGCSFGTLSATLDHVTIAENSAFSGGGINVNNLCFPVDIKNSIVANNTTGGDCAISNGGLLNSQGHNLSSDNTCTTFTAASLDLPNTPPNIGPLADNGGVLSLHPMTHALAFNSAAVDAVPPAACTDIKGNPLTVDERGLPRPGVGLGPNCDIGAFELQAAPQLTVSPSSLTYTSTIGVTTSAQTITVTSTGNVPATVTGDTLGGANAGQFAISQDNCTGKTLNPTETCTVLVTFTPNAAGTFNGNVVFTSSNASFVPSDTVTLIGTATITPIPPITNPDFVFGDGCSGHASIVDVSGPIPVGPYLLVVPILVGGWMRRRKK